MTNAEQIEAIEIVIQHYIYWEKLYASRKDKKMCKDEIIRWEGILKTTDILLKKRFRKR